MQNTIEELEYQWYFSAEDDPYQNTDKPKWSPYNVIDNRTIENAYQKELSKGNFEGKVKINVYTIDFY